MDGKTLTTMSVTTGISRMGDSESPEEPSVDGDDSGRLDKMKRDVNASARGIEKSFGWDEPADTSEFNIMQAIQAVGGAVIAIAIVTIVVNAVLTTNAVDNSSGPFSGVIDSLETTGVSAMVLLVIGLLVAAATRLMSMFQGGF
jgi:hypothetical protein